MLLDIMPPPAFSFHTQTLSNRLHTLETEEQSLLSQLSVIRATQFRVRAELAELQNSYGAPILKLPDEVLGMVFRHLALMGGWRNIGTGTEDVDIDDNDRDREGPVSLSVPYLMRASHVIKRWRTVALSIPSLWSTLEARPSKQCNMYPKELISAYLSRSKPTETLLDIFVYISEDMKESDAILHMLLPEVHRWGRLAVESIGEESLFHIVRGLRGLSAPRLVHFQLDLEIVDEQSEVLWDGDGDYGVLAGMETTSMSSLALRGINLGTYLPPLHSLTHLYMADCYSALLLSFAQLRSILSLASPSLVSLELEGMVNCVEEDDLSLLTLPRLEILSVLPPDYVNPIHYMTSIFTSLDVPRLQKLYLRKAYGSQFHKFLDTFRSGESHPLLTTMHLESITGLEHMTTTFPLSSPTITHLTLKFAADISPILALLTSNKEDLLWPELKVLTVGPVSDRDRGLLRCFIMQRNKGGKPVERLRYGTESWEAFENVPEEEMGLFRARVVLERVSYHDM